MGNLNAEGMKEIATAKKTRADELNALLAQPFKITNEAQLTAVKKYIDEFELSVNQMYLFQVIKPGFLVWGGTNLIGALLPLPGFVNYLSSLCLYACVTGYILQNFSPTDFYNQLEEMKSIYNWSLKGGKEFNERTTNNTDKLNHPDIQRMIKLMTPFCPIDFMQAWPKVTENETKNGLVAFFSSRFFSSNPEPSNTLKTLQNQVETGALGVNMMGGTEQAIRYFATTPNFKVMMMKNIQEPINLIKNMLPEAVSSSFIPK